METFYIARYELLIDPIDFAEESWDWDGDGIADFWGEYDYYLELLATLTGYGDLYEAVDLLIPLADEAAPLLLSPYVSPDPMVLQYWYDGVDVSDALAEDWFDDDQNLVTYVDAEIGFDTTSEVFFLEVYDRDLVFDDYAGWDYLDLNFARAVADCGPFVYVYSDREMRDNDSRIRAMGIEIESW